MEAFIGALPRIRLGRVSVETQRYRSQVKFETNFSHPFKNSTTFYYRKPGACSSQPSRFKGDRFSLAIGSRQKNFQNKGRKSFQKRFIGAQSFEFLKRHERMWWWQFSAVAHVICDTSKVRQINNFLGAWSIFFWDLIEFVTISCEAMKCFKWFVDFIKLRKGRIAAMI